MIESEWQRLRGEQDQQAETGKTEREAPLQVERSIPDTERPASPDELKEALGKPKSSEERGSESATVFESIQGGEMEHRQPEHPSVERVGDEPKRSQRGIYWSAFKEGLANRRVRAGYAVSAASFPLAVFVGEITGIPDVLLILAGPVQLLLSTSVVHYRDARRSLEDYQEN